MIVSGFMGMVFINFSHLPDSWVKFSVRIHLLVSCFGITRFMGMIFRNSPDLWVYFLEFSPDLRVYFREISPDLWMVLLRFEWQSPMSWKLKLPPGNFS